MFLRPCTCRPYSTSISGKRIFPGNSPSESDVLLVQAWLVQAGLATATRTIFWGKILEDTHSKDTVNIQIRNKCSSSTNDTTWQQPSQ